MAQYQVQDPAGQMHVIEGPDGASPDEVVNQAQNIIPPSMGKTESFARGAANNFPLLPQAIAKGESATGIGDEGGYSANLADWKQKAEEAKTANPKTYGAGSVTGALAPLAIPYVGEAMEASPIATNAAMGAANAISDTDLSKNPENTLKQAGEGAAVGGATAGILGKILPSSEGLESLASKKAVQSVELPPGIVGAMTPEERTGLGKFLQDNNLVGEDKSKVLEQARKLSDQFGKKIGEIGDTTEGSGLTADPDMHMQKINDLLDKANTSKNLEGLDAKKDFRTYTSGAGNIANLGDNPSWSDIQALKDKYGGFAFGPKGEVKSEGAKDTYFALKDMLKNIAEKAQANPNLGDEYKQALAGYSRMQPIESGLQKAVDAELRGEGAGMGVRGLVGAVRKLPGTARAIVGTGAALTGHPYIAGAAALPEIMNPAIQSKVASGAANFMPKIHQGLTQEIMDYVNHKNSQQ